ncbi:hypothetical protein [Vibrio alginolyticus]|uniref:hypothetical protein n=1 Tax=Vibrio alginolyticus TaxID=663 RepID=UPI001C0607FC|nr:hypothetical protein [Vibrio alginolyticus]
MNKLDEDIGSFAGVYSLFGVLDEYHDKQYLDNLEYKRRSEKELSDYISSAQKSMEEMGEDYDYHNYDYGVEQELRLEEMAANAQFDFFNEAKELHALALIEMKVMFLYKEIEIRLKQIISTYYSQKTSQLSNLRALNSCFASNGVALEEINGYQFIDDLRRVNNDLKHSLKINASKKIKVFKSKTKFDSESLGVFLNLASYEIESFFKLLIRKINGEDVVELGDSSFLGEIPF